jgi:S1-C subfamily serine protease
MKRNAIPMWLALVTVFGFQVVHSSTRDAGGNSEAPSRLDNLLGIRTVPGAFIMDLTSGGPAARAGFDVCNLIAGFNGRTLRQFGELQAFVSALREAAASTGLDVDVWKPKNPDEGYRRDRVKIRVPLPTEVRMGADVVFQLMVLGVVEGGPADAAGVGIWEFIDQINDQKVANIRSLAELDQKIGEFVNRDGAVTLTLARWHPIRDSENYKTGFVTRDVEVKITPAGPDPGR